MHKLIQTLPGWKGEINHKEAEKLLMPHKAGTYLLRKGDPITSSIKDNLSEANKAEIDCYILTILEENEKIEDIMLIKVNDKWTLHHDDPNLLSSFYIYFNCVEELLNSLKDKAKYPLS